MVIHAGRQRLPHAQADPGIVTTGDRGRVQPAGDIIDERNPQGGATQQVRSAGRPAHMQEDRGAHQTQRTDAQRGFGEYERDLKYNTEPVAFTQSRESAETQECNAHNDPR